jgi:hypothetical protein
MGILSAKSQNLHQVITSLVKFHGSDQRIYIKAEGRKALGFLRVGEKTLFYRDYVTCFLLFSMEASNKFILLVCLIFMFISLARELELAKRFFRNFSNLKENSLIN